MSDSVIENAKATIESSLRECDSHVKKMERAGASLANRFPLNGEKLKGLDEETITRVDQFIYRFMKLQDSLATRLLPSLDTIIRADDSPRPFLDMLASLEKFGIVPQETDWQFFRDLCNNLAHDYPESVGQTAATLNVLYDRWRSFAAILTNAREYFLKFLKEHPSSQPL